MSGTTSHIPEGFHTVTPYLSVDGAVRLIDFLTQAFGATEIERQLRPDGTIMHAAVRLGDSIVELSDASKEWGSMPAALHLYVPDTDAAYRRALDAGASSLYEPANMDYGERSAGVKDPTGNNWYIATFQPRA